MTNYFYDCINPGSVSQVKTGWHYRCVGVCVCVWVLGKEENKVLSYIFPCMQNIVL